MFRSLAGFPALALAAAVLGGSAAPAAADYDGALAALKSGGDVAAACTEITALAMRGEAGAMYTLSDLYRHGTCGAVDPALARKWHRRAAERGDAYARMTLGSNYRLGADGLPKDFVRAYMWYELAVRAPKPRSRAAPGDAFSQLLPLTGTAAFGDTAADLQATLQRDRLARRMTPAQIAKAKRMARDWKPPAR